jgi:hypothetical protein
MPLLRDHPDDLDALVAATASSLRLDTAFVEKDFWVIEVLRAATAPIQTTAKDGSQHPVRTIFKGGTSLSQAYGLIERFSEDVDLLVSFPQVDIGIGARDKVLKAIRDAVARHLATTGVQGAVTTGVKRYIRYPYPARHGSPEVTEGVLLEMGSRGGAFPTREHDLPSMIANHAVDTLGEADDAWDEFESVSVAVLAPERTLLEKLALLHDAASRYPDDNARAKLLRGGRHLYDVHKLLSSDDVIATLSTLGPAGVADLCRDIDDHSENADFSFTTRPAAGYQASPLLDPKSPCRDALRQGYATAMTLVYGEQPTLEDCIQSIRASGPLL